eukprot:282218_1
MNAVCTGNDYKAFQIAFLITDGLLLLTYAPLLYLYSQATCKFKSMKTLLYASVLFMFFNVLFLLSQFAMIAVGCHRDPLKGDFYDAWMMTSYIFQTYGILLMAYCRLYHIFAPSMFALSKCTNIVYTIVLIIIPVCLITSVLFEKTELAALLMGVGILALIISLISTMILFIRKLKKVFKSSDSTDEFIGTITKLTILNAISFTITLMIPIIIIIEGSVAHPTKDYVITSAFMMFAMTADAYSNLWCILLSFSNFNDYYMKICGCLHSKCKSLCNNISGVNERNLALQTAKSNSSVTVPGMHSKTSEMSSDIPSVGTTNSVTHDQTITDVTVTVDVVATE